MKPITAHCLVLFGLVIAACGGEPDAPAGQSGLGDDAIESDTREAKTGGTESGGAKIAWFEGTVDEAFAYARAEDKPVYLYWGAEWCPPCHMIKATVFTSPDFIERSKLFVPVYLDGDKENAQAAGERFGVLGYPTMIVFSPDGTELTRIPGGIDLAAYANVLDLALSNSSSTRDLVERLLADGGSLTADECEQLAYYSWGQDPQVFADRDAVAAFRRMYASCPDASARERTILYMGWLERRVGAAESDEEGATELTDAEKREALTTLRSILEDETLAKDNVSSVVGSGAAITKAITDSGSEERRELEARFDDAYDRLYADEGLYKLWRISTLVGRINFERMDDPDAELSDALTRRIIGGVAWADESTASPARRQPIINAAAYVLVEAGLDEQARDLLVAELEISKQPYYFMTTLAGIEQRAGNDDAALAWLKRGWDESVGPATRFQWGYYYLNGLIEMAPEDADAIRTTTLTLIEELQASGGFFQRPKAGLARIETKLETWGEEHGEAATLAQLRADLSATCAADPDESSREVCEQFLESA